MLEHFGDPQSFGALIVTRRQGNCAPFAPIGTPLVTARTDAPQQTIVLSLRQRLTRTFVFKGGKILISPAILRHCEENEQESFSGRWFCLSNFPNAQRYREVFPEFYKILLESFPPHCTPIALTQKLWQNTTYPQLDGLNNWFNAFTIIVGSTIKYLQSKIRGMTAPFAPTRLRVMQQWLIAVWFSLFCYNCKPVDNSRWP